MGYKEIEECSLAEDYEDVEPGDFVRFQIASPREIERTEIIPPKLGKSGYGKIRVYFRRPRCRSLTRNRGINNTPLGHSIKTCTEEDAVIGRKRV